MLAGFWKDIITMRDQVWLLPTTLYAVSTGQGASAALVRDVNLGRVPYEMEAYHGVTRPFGLIASMGQWAPSYVRHRDQARFLQERGASASAGSSRTP